MAEPADQPLGVAGGNAGDGLAELVHGVAQFRPQALLLQGADPAFGAAIGFGLTQKRGIVSDAQPAIEPRK